MKKKIIKTCAVFMACLTLSLSMFQAYTVSVQASAISISLPRAIDLILTNQGIVANQASLSSIGDVLLDTLNTSMTGYFTYCKENGLDWKSQESYQLWKENTNIVNALLDAIIKSKQNNGDDDNIVDTDIVDVVIEPNGDTNKVIPKSIQQPIVDAYKTWWEDCGGYYLVYVPSYKEMSAYCSNAMVYENIKNITSAHDYIYIHSYSAKDDGYYYVFDLDGVYDGFVLNSSYSSGLHFFLYDDWKQVSCSVREYSYFDDNGVLLGTSENGLDKYYYNDFTTYSLVSTKGCYPEIKSTTWNGFDYFSGLVSCNSHYVRIWKTLEGLKAYTVGAQNVYYSPTYTTVVNNDMTVTTDYITNNLNNYSYSQVQQEIDNSTDITEETVNNIVTNNVTNITNNYYYTSSAPDSDGTTSGGDSNSNDSLNGGDYDGLFNGLLGNLLSLITSLLEFVVNLLVKGVELIVGGVTSIISLINMAMEQIGDLGGILSAFMPFVPEEYFVLIMGTISVLCGLAIYKFLKG